MKRASEAGEVNIFRLSSGEYIIYNDIPYFFCMRSESGKVRDSDDRREESRRIYCRLNVGC
jgi:hypothetical protein